MSDWSEAEFNALLGSNPPPQVGNALTGSPALGDVSDIKSGFGRELQTPPATRNWTATAGVMPPVVNQGICGSCWVFSAIT